MRRRANHRVMFSVLVVVAATLTGCGTGSSHSPPKEQVQNAIASALPPVLSLDSVELEPISTGPESAKVNFKAVVVPKEDLYQVDREVEGTPRVTLLKVVQATGTKMSLYGSVAGHRTMDLWILESPNIQTGLEQLGKPRGAFHAQSYVTGSSEALAAIKQQAANAEIERQAKEAKLKQEEIERVARGEREAREEKARKERQEQARITFEEQQRKDAEQRKKEEEQRKEEEEAALQKLRLATAAGTHYVGTISYENSRQRILVVFAEQDKLLVRAEVSNPDNPKEKRPFAGELFSDPKPEKSGTAYPIQMASVGAAVHGQGDFSEVSHFWSNPRISFKLQLTDTGLEGEATDTIRDYTFRLQPGTAAPPRVRPKR